MSVLRCPQCGRTADGVECFACGHVWPRPEGAGAAALPPPPPKGPPPEAPVPSHSSPFGVPVQEARAAPSSSRAPPSRPPAVPAAVAFEGGQSAPPPRRASAAGSAVAPPAPSRSPTPATSPALTPPSPPWSALEDNVVTSPSPLPARSVAAWVVNTVPSGSFVERLLRSPLGFVISGGLSFMLVVGFGSLLLLGSEDPVLRRIDSGKAGSVIEEVLTVPVAARTPRQYLLLGHAYARNGATPQALSAYREAAKKGGADERALDYTIAALDHPLAKQPIEVLADWQSEDVTKRLTQLIKEEGWHLRHNALKVLQERQETTAAIVESVAILDVLHGPDCDRRREGLHRLESLGAGDDALDAVQSLRDNYKENFCIPLTELDRAQISVEKR